MKKTLFLCLTMAIAMMIMPSCKKAEKQIIGKWKITHAKTEGYTDKYAVGETWTFKEGGKFIGYLDFGKKKGNSKDSEIECNWRINGDELVLEGGDLDYSESGYDYGDYYSYKQNIVFTFDIEQLDKSNLVVSGKMKEDWSETEDGETYHGTGSYKTEYELEAK